MLSVYDWICLLLPYFGALVMVSLFFVVLWLLLLLWFFSAGSETQAQGTPGKPSITELI